MNCPNKNTVATVNTQSEEHKAKLINTNTSSDNSTLLSNKDVQEWNNLITHVSNNNTSGPSNEMQKWLLLDNQSTTNIFCDKTLLTGIRKVPITMNLKTNGGTLKCQEMGHLPNYGDVWYHKDAITNILSLKNMQDQNYKIDIILQKETCLLCQEETQ